MGCIRQNRSANGCGGAGRLAAIGLGVLAVACLVNCCYDRTAAAISEKKYNAISQNCATIRQSLKTLQKNDSRTRSYLGTTYETIATKFMIPLNVRLAKNGRPDADLAEIQSDFTFVHSQFKEKYTEYMKELETLIGMECQRYPDAFYQRLEQLRESREKLQKSVKSLAKLSAAQMESVSALRGSL